MARMQGVSSRAGGVSWVFHRALSHPTTSWFQSRTRARASKRVYRTVFLILYLRRNQMAWGWAWRFANQSSKGTAAAFGRCLDPPMVPSFNSLCRPWMAVPENGHDFARGEPPSRSVDWLHHAALRYIATMSALPLHIGASNYRCTPQVYASSVFSCRQPPTPGGEK